MSGIPLRPLRSLRAPLLYTYSRYNLPVRIISRQKAIYFFLSFGVCLAALAGAVGSGWVILNWREGVKVFLGVIFFGAIVAGPRPQYDFSGP